MSNTFRRSRAWWVARQGIAVTVATPIGAAVFLLFCYVSVLSLEAKGCDRLVQPGDTGWFTTTDAWSWNPPALRCHYWTSGGTETRLYRAEYWEWYGLYPAIGGLVSAGAYGVLRPKRRWYR